MPLLPEASCVVFDEGHLLELAAQKGLTYRFNFDALNKVLTGYMGQDVREESLVLVEDILMLHEEWFDLLGETATAVEGSNRLEVPLSETMIGMARRLHDKVEQLLEQLVFDAELFTIEDYHIKIIEEYLEFFSYGLSILLKEDEGIFWLEENSTTSSLVIMPRLVEDVLKKEVFSQELPFVFSSATLSQGGDFSYLANNLGIKTYDACSVASPFDYAHQMEINGYIEKDLQDKWQKIGEQLLESAGKALVLFSSSEEMNQFRQWAATQDWPFQMLYEGDREISEMVIQFQKHTSSVLCSYNLWEGLDVPGEALSTVIISSLPFPPKDPVFQAKRKEAEHPEQEVDAPYMILRLRQGIGRLIRTNEDKGTIHIWMTEAEKQVYQQTIEQVLPVKMK